MDALGRERIQREAQARALDPPSASGAPWPPDLEALIFRLLARAPSDRPSSTTEVPRILEGIDPRAKTE